MRAEAPDSRALVPGAKSGPQQQQKQGARRRRHRPARHAAPAPRHDARLRLSRTAPNASRRRPRGAETAPTAVERPQRVPSTAIRSFMRPRARLDGSLRAVRGSPLHLERSVAQHGCRRRSTPWAEDNVRTDGRDHKRFRPQICPRSCPQIPAARPLRRKGPSINTVTRRTATQA